MIAVNLKNTQKNQESISAKLANLRALMANDDLDCYF